MSRSTEHDEGRYAVLAVAIMLLGLQALFMVPEVQSQVRFSCILVGTMTRETGCRKNRTNITVELDDICSDGWRKQYR